MSCHADALRVFADHVVGDASLEDLLAEMRELRDLGISSKQVLSLLEELRLDCPASPREDRILDVMDYAAGFCSVENTIWPDEVR